MRKYLILAAVALVAMLVPSFASAQDGGVQSLVAKVTPSKLDKKKFRPAQIFIDVITKNNDEPQPVNQDQPPSADRTRVDFSSNLKFNTTTVPNCEASEAELQNTDTETATELCGSKSIVSVGGGKEGSNQTGATVLIDMNPIAPSGSTQVDVEVTAFNGTEKDTIFLFARADAVNNTSVLVGKLTKGEQGFGSTLDVTIPDLLAGAISDFKTTVKAGSYVTARCKDKTPMFQARTEYENHAPTTAEFTDKCTQKKTKKKKGGKGGK